MKQPVTEEVVINTNQKGDEGAYQKLLIQAIPGIVLSHEVSWQSKSKVQRGTNCLLRL